jgi:aminoglycoside N3'-acetyltransferase
METSFGRPRSVSRGELAWELEGLGVEQGGVLLVHTSFRAVRPVDGGPAGLIQALRDVVGPGGTIVMPSWGAGDDDTVFDPATSPVARDLGVTAEIFRHLPGVARSNHPFAFAAQGPQAAAITRDPLPVPPHRLESPVGRVYEMDGQILLLGVGHDTNTTIHLAEVLAGVPYGVAKHVTVMEGGRRLRIDYRENDHCCRRFALAEGWMRSREVRLGALDDDAPRMHYDGRVGHASARLVRSRDVVSVVREHLERDPLVFLHAHGSGCAECDEARESISPDARAALEAAERDREDRRVVRLLERDIVATLGSDHGALVEELALRAGQLFEDDLARRTVDGVQQYFHDTFVDTTWPACPRHPNHPLWFRDDAWWCERDGTAVAALGQLRSS